MTIQEMYQEMEDQMEDDCDLYDDCAVAAPVEVDYTTQA